MNDSLRPMNTTGGWRIIAIPVICFALLITFYVCAWRSSRAQSATMDEPLHALGAYLHVFEADFRINPEDPPLWNYWAMLPHHAGKLVRDLDAERRQGESPESINAFMISTRRLYQTPGNDGAAFVNASRAMMLLVGVMLGAAASIWAWQCAGPVAALVVCVLIAFDPNLLAHAPLVKNDVSIAAIFFCLAWATWNVGRRARWYSAAAAVLLCAAAPAVKFSGILACVTFVVMIVARALLPIPWRFMRRELTTRRSRAVAGASLVMSSILASILVIWASYGCRYYPTRIDEQLLDTAKEVRLLKQTRFYLENERRWPTDAEMEALPLPLIGEMILFAERHRLLPQAWLHGLLFTYRSTLVRESFLLGEYGNTGWWYYFPLTMIFKTPVATLVALAGSAMLIPWLLKRSQSRRDHEARGWTAICIAAPLGVYGVSALTTNLNLGLRHMLPVYPFLYLCVGIAAARFREARPRAFAVACALLMLGLVFESLAAFPHYLSFFNAPARSYRLRLLSDSNFDWGQDLPYLATWQREHPGERLYLGYFGTVDPVFYGIRYTNIPGGFVLNPNYEWPPQQRGVVAISATLLQGVNCPPSCRVFYAPFRDVQPREIVGDTIYLYNWPPR